MSDPAALTHPGRLTLLEHLNLEVAITEEQIRLLANTIKKRSKRESLARIFGSNFQKKKKREKISILEL